MRILYFIKTLLKKRFNLKKSAPIRIRKCLNQAKKVLKDLFKTCSMQSTWFWRSCHWIQFRSSLFRKIEEISTFSKSFRIPLFPIMPQYVRNYAGLMIWYPIWSGRRKSGKAKLCRSICLVMKIFWKNSTGVVWPFKKRFCQNRSKKNGRI